MVILAKRVRANLPPEKIASTASAAENLRRRAKISHAWSIVSIQQSAFSRPGARFQPCEPKLPAFVLLRQQLVPTVYKPSHQTNSDRGQVESDTPTRWQNRLQC